VEDPDPGFALLPPGGLAYFVLDIPGSRPLPDLIFPGELRGASVSDLLDRTESAVAAVFEEAGERRFFLRAEGRYPSFWAGLSFIFDPAWKKVRSLRGERYWRSERDRLSVILGPREALVSDGDPYTAEPGPEAPAALAELRRGAVLAGWVPHTAGYADRLLEMMMGGPSREALPLHIPAEQLVFGVYPSAAPGEAPDPLFDLTLRVETPSASHARGLASMVSMLRLMAGGRGAGGSGTLWEALLFAAPPVLDGNALILRAAGIKAGDIALLFNLFSLYSK
jgi:hypothetical protein